MSLISSVYRQIPKADTEQGFYKGELTGTHKGDTLLISVPMPVDANGNIHVREFTSKKTGKSGHSLFATGYSVPLRVGNETFKCKLFIGL